MGIDTSNLLKKPSVLNPKNIKNPMKGTFQEAEKKVDSHLKKIKNPLK
jgi:hypothetical protein